MKKQDKRAAIFRANMILICVGISILHVVKKYTKKAKKSLKKFGRSERFEYFYGLQKLCRRLSFEFWVLPTKKQ